jgi:hypothetical protein
MVSIKVSPMDLESRVYSLGDNLLNKSQRKKRTHVKCAVCVESISFCSCLLEERFGADLYSKTDTPYQAFTLSHHARTEDA